MSQRERVVFSVWLGWRCWVPLLVRWTPKWEWVQVRQPGRRLPRLPTDLSVRALRCWPRSTLPPQVRVLRGLDESLAEATDAADSGATAGATATAIAGATAEAAVGATDAKPCSACRRAGGFGSPRS